MTEWQQFCLAQMGIERWERRPIPFRLGMITKTPLLDAEKRLLSAILTAIDCTEAQVSRFDVLPESTDCSVLWLMTGEAVDIPGKVVLSVPLSRLLADPLQKRAVFWALYGMARIRRS